MQAKWACMIFSGKMKLPNNKEMKEFNYKKENDLMVQRMEYANGGHFLLAESIANEMNILQNHAFETNAPFWTNPVCPTRNLFSKNKMNELLSSNYNKIQLNRGFEFFYKQASKRD